VPGAKTVLVPGAGHSPNVEKPAKTAALVLRFAAESGGSSAKSPASRHELQEGVQKR
jgi:hypothetical protein